MEAQDRSPIAQARRILGKRRSAGVAEKNRKRISAQIFFGHSKLRTFASSDCELGCPGILNGISVYRQCGFAGSLLALGGSEGGSEELFWTTRSWSGESGRTKMRPDSRVVDPSPYC